jgi:hypothetical protein
MMIRNKASSNEPSSKIRTRSSGGRVWMGWYWRLEIGLRYRENVREGRAKSGDLAIGVDGEGG